MSDLTGNRVGNRYEIRARLGQGGMATVYRAYDTRLDRDVAIKVIRTDMFAPAVLQRVLARFEREAKSLGRLSHPNIVGVIDFGEENGMPYLVMEYLPGGTLKQKMGIPMPWDEAVRLILPIAHALRFAHSMGIIHRDIKPSNILITHSGEPMLTDFGIAKIVESDHLTSLTGTGLAVGTPEYMSPEQWQGNATYQSDIYALGVVLYEMVTGQKPYTGDTPAAILIKQSGQPLPRPTVFVQHLPRSVENVIVKALAFKPEDRFASMAEFVDALQRLLRGEEIEFALFDSGATQMPVSQVTLDVTVSPPARPVISAESSRHLPSSALPQQKKRPAWSWAVLAAVIVLCLSGIGGAVTLAPVLFLSAPASTPLAATFQPDLVLFTQAPTTVLSANPSVAALTIETPTVASPTHTPTISPTVLSEPSGKIVYTCQIYALENRDQICSINPDGTGFRQLTNDSEHEHFYPSIAADGGSIVFSAKRTGTFEIYEMDLSGNIRQVSGGLGDLYAPEISPDGRYIVFTRDEGDFQAVWLMNRDGSNPRLVYRAEDKDALDPTWSPDGRILFAMGILENKQLYVVDIDGNDLHLVNDSFTTRGRSDWSPNGRLIASYSGPSGDRRLYIMNADGSALRQVSAPGSNALAPAFSPDSQWIVFMSYMDNPGNPNGCEIYIMRIDGSDVRRVTNNAYCDYQPRWGP